LAHPDMQHWVTGKGGGWPGDPEEEARLKTKL
jgi:hypothetical protein